MANSTVNASDVTFSAGARLAIGPALAAAQTLSYIGLVGEDIDLGIQQELRTKTDQFPRVPVKTTVLSQQMTAAFVARELNATNFKYAFGIADADVTTVSAGDTAVTDEAVIINSDGLGVLAFQLKAGESITSVQDAAGGSGTASVEDTDFKVIERDSQGKTVIQVISGGNLSAGDTVYVDYTYVARVSTEFVIGKSAVVPERAVLFTEDYTNGKKLELYMPRAQVSIPGNMTANSAENGGEFPLSVTAQYESTISGLAVAKLYEAS